MVTVSLLYKTFFLVTDKETHKASVFVPNNTFLLSLMFVSKTGANSRQEHLRGIHKYQTRLEIFSMYEHSSLFYHLVSFKEKDLKGWL
jgi:hypothetical protein